MTDNKCVDNLSKFLWCFKATVLQNTTEEFNISAVSSYLWLNRHNNQAQNPYFDILNHVYVLPLTDSHFSDDSPTPDIVHL